MHITVLKSKISYAKITHTELYYEGSITIDEAIMEAAGLQPFEQVHVVNLSNGERLVTYVITGARNSGIIGLNGPAARKGLIGDDVHILSYAQTDPKHSIDPKVVALKRGLNRL